MGLLLNALAYAGSAMVAYYLAFFLLSVRVNRRARAQQRPACAPRFVIVVPARDEALVIGETVRRLRALDGDHLALVMDDGSSDGTAEIARAAAEEDPRVVVVRRGPERAGRGKGDVLNHAVALTVAMTESADGPLAGADPADVVIGVVDADGWLEPHALRDVGPYFADADVGGVQLPVRMWNAHESFLTLMQDIEFLGFSRLVQAGRDPLGSVGLGGNGQFVRLAALTPLGDEPWTRCLTEDLDLTMTLIERGWRIRFCPTACVAQQAVTRLRPLLRQRARWIQGHYSCWQHVLPVLRAPGVPLGRRLDAAFYLVAVVFVVVFAALLLAALGTYAGLLPLHTPAFAFLGDGMLYSGVTLALTLVPVIFVAATYRAAPSTRVPLWALPGVFLLFTFYGYGWAVPATVRAWTRLVLRRDHWVKTPRTVVTQRVLRAEDAALAEVA